MTWRNIGSIVVSIVAALGPLLLLVRWFGLEERVQLAGPDAVKQLLALGGALLGSFVGGLAAALLRRTEEPPSITDVPNAVLRFHADARRNRNQPRAA